MDVETMYTVVTLNGRAFMFAADEMNKYMGTYTFLLEGETVAEFKKDAIAGYFISRVEYDEEAEG